jgi:glycosyltransferase involved in cell wall biosynthesis
VARKGAYAVRDAARIMDLEVVLCGSELEGAGFWNGLAVSRPDGDWLEGVGAVVQPAIVEEQPRRLLEALAAGVPVIASAACGLSPRPGLTLVASDDPGALAEALAAVQL